MKRLGRSQTLVSTLKGGSGKPLEDFKKGWDIDYLTPLKNHFLCRRLEQGRLSGGRPEAVVQARDDDVPGAGDGSTGGGKCLWQI